MLMYGIYEQIPTPLFIFRDCSRRYSRNDNVYSSDAQDPVEYRIRTLVTKQVPALCCLMGNIMIAKNFLSLFGTPQYCIQKSLKSLCWLGKTKICFHLGILQCST